MIIKTGNIFESKCNTLVNAVNCVGVMGKGIALEFKRRYPEMYLDYVDRCKAREVKTGKPYVYQNSDEVKILNFPTKAHWKSASHLSYIAEGLDWFIKHYDEYGIKSVAFPALGCGNGGLRWEDVEQIMFCKLYDLPIEIEIYAPCK